MKLTTSLPESIRRWAALGLLVFNSQVVAAAQLPPEVFAGLSSQKFQEREAAEVQLLEWSKLQPESAKDELFKQSASADDPEVRVRCLSVLRTLVFEDYAREGEGYMGISMRDDLVLVPGDDKQRSVIRVMATMPDTAAAVAGIQPNDLIVSLADEVWHDVKAYEVFMKQIRAMKPGAKVKLRILRAGNIVEIIVTLGRRPVMADQLWFQGNTMDLNATERAAKEAYFRRWLDAKRVLK